MQCYATKNYLGEINWIINNYWDRGLKKYSIRLDYSSFPSTIEEILKDFISIFLKPSKVNLFPRFSRLQRIHRHHLASFQNLIRTWMKVWLWSCLAGFWFILSGLPETARGFNGLSWRSAGLARICGLELSKECFFAETSGNFNRQFKWEELSLDVIKITYRLSRRCSEQRYGWRVHIPSDAEDFFGILFVGGKERYFFRFPKWALLEKRIECQTCHLLDFLNSRTKKKIANEKVKKQSRKHYQPDLTKLQ